MADIIKPEVLPAWTPEDKIAASEIAQEIELTVSGIQTTESALATNWIRLGILCSKVKNKQFWILWNFKNFNDYVLSLKEKVGKGRTQIYHAVSVVDKLLPYIPEEMLKEIGISKAIVLKQYVAQVGKAPSNKMLASAVDQTKDLSEFKAEVFKETKTFPDDPATWLDMGGFYMTEDEMSEHHRFEEVSSLVDPPIDNTLPEWAIRKERYLRAIREFLATYESTINNASTN